MQSPDYSKPGFVGDDNIYGIGIRVGYYTQAASLWVANFYARHEVPYLHSLTLMFLIALFIGLCLLCKEPRNTYAVEPFMLLTVAYNTLYMGLFDLRTPYLLSWEINFREKLYVDLVWIAFYGFDMWYWWSGVWVMKPSNGPQGTVIFFPYVGSAEIYGWIHIVARVYNAVAVLLLLISIISLCCYAAQQRKMNRMMSAQRMLELTTHWLQFIDRRWGSSQPGTSVDALTGTSGLIVPESAWRKPSDVSVKPAGPDWSHLDLNPYELDAVNNASCKNEENQGRDGMKVGNASLHKSISQVSPPGYVRPPRTETGLLKKRLLGWSAEKDTNSKMMPPDYMAYEPSFQRLKIAFDTLTMACAKSSTKEFRGRKILVVVFGCPRWLLQLCVYAVVQIRHPCRPAVLFAALSHAHNVGTWDTRTYPQILRGIIQSPAYPEIQSHDLVLASRMYLLKKPPTKPPSWLTIMVGWATLGACSVLVISIELTIQWNKISGVQNIRSVGQMIPFVLGVGGLLKVVYAAIYDKEHQEQGLLCHYRHCHDEEEKKDWIEAGSNFEKCLAAYERSLTLTMLKGNESNI